VGHVEAVGLTKETNMERTAGTPQPGDRVVFERADGNYDVFRVSVSGEEEVARLGLPDFETAYAIARGELDGGRVWCRRYSTPDLTEPCH